MREAGAQQKGFSTASFIERLPEGFVVIDRDGVVRAANGAFLEIVQLGAEAAATQRKLARWLSNPGADADVVMSLIRKNGDLRRFQTRIEGELGQSTPVEITAVGDDAQQPNYYGLLIRDIGRAAARTVATEGTGAAGQGVAIEEFDNRTLEAIVRMSTEVIERKAILRALDLCGGNRTAAARQLGLSRQSLHAKLKKYGLEQK
jgi:transcriptional regulator PpsR